MDEKRTRKALIDKALDAAGWTPIVRYRPGDSYDTAAVEEYETTAGPADYILFHQGEALAAVEAKRLSLGPQNVLVQAQRYARGFRSGSFEFHGFRLPFIYSTNGEIFWFQDLRREDRERLQKRTFSGGEIVLETRRLAMMNLYLHEIEAEIYYGDSLAEGPHTGRRYDCVLTNPPFGTKGGGDAPVREDFTVQTSNKQLNFLQHVMNILKPGGRAAIVLPDNVLFEDHAGRDVRRLLTTDCDLHTILRLPIGTFTPYSPGVKANLLFFRKGLPTEEVWIYDLRTNVEKVTKRHPLSADYFADFEACYHARPRGETERFRRFTRNDITRRDDNLDIFWLKDESLQDADDLPEPEDLVSEAVTQLETALDALRDLALQLQENGK